MTRKTLLALTCMLVIGLMAIPAYAASYGSPLDQINSGIPMKMIQCNDDKLLMQSPAGKPVCLTIDTASTLHFRGYQLIIFIDDNIESNENIAVPTNPLQRYPAPIPIHGNIYGTSEEEAYMEMDTTYDALMKKKEVLSSGPSGQSDEFNIINWVPDYVPKGYELEFIIASPNGGNMLFKAPGFVVTLDTTKSELLDNGGIEITIWKNIDLTQHDEISDYVYYSSLGMTIVDQTNDYFGIININNGLSGFYIESAYADGYLIHLVSDSDSDLTKSDGVQMLNSIRGDIFTFE